MSENTPVYEKILEELVDRDCGGHYAMVSSVFDHLESVGNNEPWQLMVLEVLTIAIQHKIKVNSDALTSVIEASKNRESAQNALESEQNVGRARLPSLDEKQAQNGCEAPQNANLGASVGCQNTERTAPLNKERTKDNDN